MNLSQTTSAPSYLNILKVTQSTFSGGATPADAGMDNNFYPTKSFTGTVVLSVPGSNGQWPGEYLLIADPGFKGQINTTSGITGCALVSGTGITQGGNCAGVGTATFVMDGVNAGIYRFTPGSATLTFTFPGTGTYQATQTPGKIAVVRNNGSCVTVTSDCYLYSTYRDATINGAPDPRGIFTPEYLQFLTDANYQTLRPMGDTNAAGSGNANTDVLWANRPTKDRFTFGAGFAIYPTGVWSGGWKAAGTISRSTVSDGTCTATGGNREVFTASATDDVPAPGGSFAYPPGGSNTYPYAYGTTVQGILEFTTLAISNLTWSSTVVTATTAAPHNIPISSFTGTISNGSGGAGTILAVTSPSGAPLSVGQRITGTGVTVNTTITAVITGTGASGTYTVSPSQNAASTTMMGANDFNVVVSGATPSGYNTGSNNGTLVATPTGASTFTYTKAADPGAMTVPGVYALSGNVTSTPRLCFAGSSGVTAYPIFPTNSGLVMSSTGSGGMTAGLATFIFDPWLNPTGDPATTGGWWYLSGGTVANGGLVSYLPFEVQIGLVNYLQKNWWPTIPLMADDDYVGQMGTLTNTLLRTGLKPFWEWGNEIWHNSWWAGRYADARGKTLGFGSARASYQSLRVGQIMGSLLPPVFSRPMQRTLAIQGGSVSTLSSNTSNLYILQGRDLGPNTKTITNISASATAPVVSSTAHGYNSGQALRFNNLTGSIGALLNGVTVYVSPTGSSTNAYQLSSVSGINVPIDTSATTYSCSGTCSTTTSYSAVFGMPEYQTGSPTFSRTVDKVENIAHAPYVGGVNLYFGDDIVPSITSTGDPTSANTAWYQALVNAWEAGTTATTRSMISEDIETGRIKIVDATCSSSTTFTTAAPHTIATGKIIAFKAPGGTLHSGLVTGAIYSLTSTGASTFTARIYTDGVAAGSAINCGSPGTGTLNVGQIGGAVADANISTMQYAVNVYSPFMEALALQFDGARPPGMSNLGSYQYEGNPEPVGPSYARCGPALLGVTSSGPTVQFTGDTNTSSNTTISNLVSYPTPGLALHTSLISGMAISGANISGATPTTSSINFDQSKLTVSGGTVTTTATGTVYTATGNCQTSIALALHDWKMSTGAAPSGEATMLVYYQQAKGLDPNVPFTTSRAGEPSHLVLLGTGTNGNNAANNAYGLMVGSLPGPSLTGYTTSPIFGWRAGIATFNNN